MSRIACRALAAFVLLSLPVVASAQRPGGESFTIGQVKSYPFPNWLTAAATGSRIAWAMNEQGGNLSVPEGGAAEQRINVVHETVRLQVRSKWGVFEVASI